MLARSQLKHRYRVGLVAASAGWPKPIAAFGVASDAGSVCGHDGPAPLVAGYRRSGTPRRSGERGRGSAPYSRSYKPGGERGGIGLGIRSRRCSSGPIRAAAIPAEYAEQGLTQSGPGGAHLAKFTSSAATTSFSWPLCGRLRHATP